jgi:hypothetical protein
LYTNRPDPISFLPDVVDASGRLYDDFSRLLFLYTHRETSTLTNEIPEESDQFRFLREVSCANIKGSVGLILTKTSDLRISTPLDLSSRSFIPLPRFIRSRHPPRPLLVPSLVFTPEGAFSIYNTKHLQAERRGVAFCLWKRHMSFFFYLLVLSG